MNGDDFPKINHDEPDFGRTGFGRDQNLLQRLGSIDDLPWFTYS